MGRSHDRYRRFMGDQPAGVIRRVVIDESEYDVFDQHGSDVRLGQTRGHVITDADPETMRGTCSSCGEVDLKAEKDGRDERPLLVCRTWLQDKRRAAKKRQAANRKARQEAR